ncbi:DUF3047 domain-containing protein [Noviherbaspirillum saxi]|uniref:DUF3047 domain-containing protein n=1 Tax=Noviherbaspirillum saxi TaxID=2320863 RepID=A0A3A3FVG8_9BURK|nr:DUF3047 domain-containing protein [Noviherbaspirillum saxi]RJF99620.1 DUF3047 domain-containing protein [Noviherbaspirillum saxi]
MNRFFVPLAVTLLAGLAGCAQQPVKPSETTATQPIRDTSLSVFSASPAGALPAGWEPLVILRTKKQTQYQLVSKENRTVLHARAESASSGLMQQVAIDPMQQPWLEWQWKITDLVQAADNTQRATEDSPVRIILGFDGDKDSLPFADQILFETAKVVTGYDFPYATLMYIWENKAPIGTVIRSTHSSRIKMMVAAQGTRGIGEWRSFARNIVEDYEKAFGEKPGKLIGVGVLTDTDNTGETVEAWYGDIRLLRKRAIRAAADGTGTESLVVGQSE